MSNVILIVLITILMKRHIFSVWQAPGKSLLGFASEIPIQSHAYLSAAQILCDTQFIISAIFKRVLITPVAANNDEWYK